MAQLHIPHAPHSEAWDTLSHIHISVVKMLLFYAVPLSVIPPAMIYYAGVTYGGNMLPMLSDLQLLTIGGVFFVVELVMTFVVAYLIRSLSDVIDMKPAFEDCYKLAVVVPTPLWLAPLFLFIPSFIVNITAGAAALTLSGILIFYSVPSILKVKDDNQAFMLSGSILAAGMVAWVTMMILTLMTWSFVSSSLLLLV
ncbi:MAG: Yip1 family protein [Sideroxyarcus sp.]|nr:Yip1 family protein [Sideroxyarcus sp.]